MTLSDEPGDTDVSLEPGRPAVVGADASEMCSYAVDMWLDDAAMLTDEAALVRVMREAAEKGQAVVLAEASHRFPNGAVTAVLVLSQSHLSVHTWPEHRAANFDLLTCGRLNGQQMISHLEAALRPARVNTTVVVRDIH
jgi:S-adenosylmethionine decarboxylase